MVRFCVFLSCLLVTSSLDSVWAQRVFASFEDAEEIGRLSLSEGVRTAPAMLLLVSLLQAAVLSYPIVRARWSGWRLVSAIFLLLYGVTKLMVAIEAVYLPEVLPADLVRHLLINGAITAAIFLNTPHNPRVRRSPT